MIRERVRMLCIPVRWRGATIAVLSRESAPSVGRQPGELERTYVEIFNRFARMIAAGEFPFAAEDSESEEAPRVGDGVHRPRPAARVEYTSPNGMSALHRMGIHQNLEGLRVSELGLDDESIRPRSPWRGPSPRRSTRAPGSTILLRCIPLIDAGRCPVRWC